MLEILYLRFSFQSSFEPPYVDVPVIEHRPVARRLFIPSLTPTFPTPKLNTIFILILRGPFLLRPSTRREIAHHVHDGPAHSQQTNRARYCDELGVDSDRHAHGDDERVGPDCTRPADAAAPRDIQSHPPCQVYARDWRKPHRPAFIRAVPFWFASRTSAERTDLACHTEFSRTRNAVLRVL